ncbi:MAG: hypothetical protein ACRDKJ_01150, partial [Actinomycetota bacterium]
MYSPVTRPDGQLDGPDTGWAAAGAPPAELGRDPFDDAPLPELVGDGEGEADGLGDGLTVIRSAKDRSAPPATGVACVVLSAPRAHAPVASARTRTAATCAAEYARPLNPRLTS